MTDRKKKALFAIALVGLVLAGGIAVWKTGLLSRLSDREQLVETLRTGGVKGPLLCIGVQFLQVVVFIIPGEITQFAAGYVFGGALGFVYSITGIMLGSAFNFFFGRVVGRPVLEKVIGQQRMQKIDASLSGAKGKTAVFLLFLTPGAPKDAMSYAAGLCNLNLGEFVVLTGLARTPALLATIVLGAQAQRRDYRAMAITAAVVVVAAGTAYLYERRRSRKNASQPKP